MAVENEDSIHFMIISTTIFVTAFFGLIGNFHVIWAVKRFPDLRSKNGERFFLSYRNRLPLRSSSLFSRLSSLFLSRFRDSLWNKDATWSALS